MPRTRLPLAGLLLTLACGSTPVTAGVALPREIIEASGMVESPTRKGVFWVHPDSQNPPLLHAVDREGRIVARARVSDPAAEDPARNPNVDWEDLALLDGDLLIADIGNNFQTRRDLSILRVAEPALDRGGEVQAVEVIERIRVRFPEQKKFPSDHRLYDAEALFNAKGSLWILSKQRQTYRTTLYKVPEGEGDEVRDLQAVQHLEVGGQGHPYGGMVTAADVSADGRYLAVLTYHALFIFDLNAAEGDRLLSQEVRRLELRGGIVKQCESVAWDGDDVLIGNETGRVFRVAEAVSGSELLFPVRRQQ